MLQVNTSGETTKFGFSPDQVEAACSRIEELEGLAVDGLMTIGPFTDD
ncbi:alanine racemase, partial [Kaarinaea lacus]